MDDRVYVSLLVEHAVDLGAVSQVSLIKNRLRMHRLDVSCLKVIEDNDLVAFFYQPINRMRADISGSAQYKNFHDVSPFTVMVKLMSTLSQPSARSVTEAFPALRFVRT